MNTTSTSGDRFYTPAELCARWKIDPRTLDKLDLPWVYLAPKTRRIRAEIVLTFEQTQRFEVSD